MKKVLKSVRKKRKMTQQHVAEKLGICRSYYTKIENGERNISIDKALKLKQILRYNNDDLFETN